MATLQQSLAFKAYEIEELADIYFFRPIGAVIAHAAHALRLTPNQISVFSGLVGIIAGSLLYFDRLGLLAFILLIFHGILDSADGQLARISGQLTGLGSVLDSLGGHATHLAIYVALGLKMLAQGSSWLVVLLAVAAGISNFVQAQLYDFYRMAYIAVVNNRRVPAEEPLHAESAWARWLFRSYRAVQRQLITTHAEVEAVLSRRTTRGQLREEDVARYRSRFYRHVRGWNLLGDNTRFYAIGVLALLHRLDWFFAFILLPMNLALLILWLWQRQADRAFLHQLNTLQ